MRALADLDRHAGPALHPAILPLEELIEELCQSQAAFRPIVIGPLLVTVDGEPLIRRRHLPPRLDRAARMQALVGPTGDDIGGDIDRAEVDFLALPIFVIQWVSPD